MTRWLQEQSASLRKSLSGKIAIGRFAFGTNAGTLEMKDGQSARPFLFPRGRFRNARVRTGKASVRIRVHPCFSGLCGNGRASEGACPPVKFAVPTNLCGSAGGCAFQARGFFSPSPSGVPPHGVIFVSRFTRSAEASRNLAPKKESPKIPAIPVKKGLKLKG